MNPMKRHCLRGLWIGLLAILGIGFGVGAQTIVGPDQMNLCDTETYTTTITNTSASQSACSLEITRSYTEAGVLYVPGSTSIRLHDATVLTNDPTSNSWDIDTLLGSPYVLPPGASITIQYDLETTCAAVSGTEQVTVAFVDCENPEIPLQNVSSASIEMLPGAIVISKTPSVQNASVDDLVSWTITVENTGLGTVSNVEATDVLGPGLTYASDTGNGENLGQTTTWNVQTTPALSSIEAGASVSIDLTAQVISCQGLTNTVDASFGCGPGDRCFDTTIDGGTAIASLNLIVENPELSFTPPNVTVDYCTDETAGLVQITNSGAGTARNVELCCSIAHLAVDPARLPPGASYADQCFSIPDIPGGESFALTFYVLHADVDWCNGPFPSGDNIFELTYTNDCNIPFVALPQFSTLSTTPGPSLSVTKSGPESLRLGETGSYNVSVEYTGSVDCGDNSPGPVTIVDTYPEGFTVMDPAGGTVDPGARTITWDYDPNIDPPFAETVRLQAPTDCVYCATPAGGTDDNEIRATGTDCCGCPITGVASAATTILCEGYGDNLDLFSSTMELGTNVVLRCSSDYNAEVTHTYTFADDPALDDLLLRELTYFVDGNDDLVYETGTVAVTGGTLGAVVDGTPSGRLEISLTDNSSVRGKTVIYTYHLSVLGLDDPSCQASSYPINAGIELDPDASAIGYCGTMYADPAQRLAVTAQPPAMSVSIAGIPAIQEYCATYDITITLTRTSTPARPYDTRLVLTNNGGSVLDLSQATCGGSVAPTDGTTCISPIEGPNTYEWRFADLFDNENDTATITFPVTIPCSGPLADLSVVAFFDDLCHDDDVYEDSCSTSANSNALLSLSANVFTRKSPEIVYATTRDVEWTLVVHNTGNGTAYNVWVDDVLGSGLRFDEANTLLDGSTATANQDHEGNPINGATFLFDELAPRELRTITLAADLVACEGLANNISASWGCDGLSCQVPRTDDSVVVVAPANLVATTFSPTPVPMCAENSATIVVKNAGVSTVYGITNTVTLPAGLNYLTGPSNLYPKVRVNGGSWSQTGEPAVNGNTLVWTSTETPELASADPRDTIEIRFNYTAFCDFTGGNLSFQASYEDPCGALHTSKTGTFALGLVPASVSTTIRQVSPAPGEALDCGGEATWEIAVSNTGSVAIPVVEVEAFLGDGLTYTSSQGDPTYGPADGGVNSGQSVLWELRSLTVGGTATLQITATAAIGGPDCEALDIDVAASWGCGDVDGLSNTFDASCTTTSPATGTISATRRPPLALSASLSPNSIEACDATTELTLTVQNTGTVATTSNIDVVIDLPSDLTYVEGSSETDCGSGTFAPVPNPTGAGQLKTWYDIAAESGASDICESIPPGDTIRLRFDVDVSCYFETQNIPITIYYYDCCGNEQYSDTISVPLTALVPSLSIDKSPVNSTLNCYDAGDTTTWTITVQNTGTGTADWIRVTDLLGSSLILDSSDSPTAGAGVSMGANTIGWEIGPLAPAETFTATVTAHLVQPNNDCTLGIRRDTATVLWGCGPLDSDPNTTAEADCDIGSTIQDQANVRIPNLSISPSDITPSFTCSGDGVVPASGVIELAVRNTGDGDITTDFEVTLTEATTGYSVSDRFTVLGGTLPLEDGTSQTLTFEDWDVGCDTCDYTIAAALDSLNEICECSENNNFASLPTTITLPDLAVDSATLSATCAGDGQIRIQGPVTLRNDGCGEALTDDLLVRFRIFDGANCAGSVIDSFTVNMTGLTLEANGGTDQGNVNVVRTLAVCNVPDCRFSILIEVDDNDAICECNGDNNALCAGTFAIALPDLTVSDIDFSNMTCASDTIAGFVRVTIENTGCGDSGAVDLRLSTDGCLAFSDRSVANLAAGSSATVDFAVTGSWTDCGDCSCIVTATIDPATEICECNGTNNTLSEPVVSALPDLEISGAVTAIGCATDGNATISADVTLENTGCADVTADYDVRVTVYNDANCTGSVVDAWSETLSGETVPAGSSNTVTLTQRILSQALCAGDCDYSAEFEVDPGNVICECDGTNNVFCLSSIASEIPNLVVTTIDPVVDCQAGTAQVTATVGNTGCGDAVGAIYQLTSPSCGLSINSAPIDLAAGTSQDIVFDYIPDCSNWNCAYIVTADPDTVICECDGANDLPFTPYPGIGSIGDTVWFDLNATGILPDPGEDGIPGVTLIIEGDLDNDGFVDFIAQTTTDANGEYLFEDLPAGDYTITVDDTTLPAGLGQTYDSDGLGTAHASSYALGENEHNREQDFGYRGIGSIGDYVWVDLNGNGIQDPEEQPLENITVTLVGDVDGDGIDETLTTTTDEDGLYLFDYLPAGDYTLTVDDTTLPAGLNPTYDADGTATAHTSDYTLGAGEDNRNQDFGYRGSGSIGDFVWFDINGDGVQDPGEPGFEGVAVTLIGDIDLDGINDILTATTDANGFYLFEYLPAGDFEITVDDSTLPEGFTQTYDYDDLGTPHASEYFLGAGEHNLEQDFGYATTGLSVDKVITDILRNGSSIGNTAGPVEPGDVIVYQFVIENVGPVPAYGVGFDDALPVGVVIETDAPGHAGIYVVTAPAANGSLSLSDEATAFTSTPGATINAGNTLTATFTAIVTSSVTQGTDLTNSAHAFGNHKDGTPIPEANAVLGDTSDTDAEDPDADDTGIVTVSALQPALSVDKTISDITRGGTSIGISGPTQPGDIVSYQFVIENVGGATAYDVEFMDTLPPGVETRAGGTYAVSSPISSGSLAIAGGQGSFSTAIAATIGGGEHLTANFDAVVTSDIQQGIELVNIGEASGVDGFGTSIPDANPAANDTADDDEEDPDPDDTGIAVLETQQPALSVSKIIADILRHGSSIGSIGPVEPGDVVVYQYTIRNVGLGTAYDVDFTDTLPTGLVTEIDAPGHAGTYTVTAPATSGSLALTDAVGTFTTSIAATIAGGEQLVATYTVRVTSDIQQGVDLVNVAAATGVDGAGTPIPSENAALGDTADDDEEDPDPDDTGIAVLETQQPALSVSKIIADILRHGSSIGSIGPVEPGDVVVYQYTIRNVGLGTAYDVDFTDTLPTGLVTEIDAPGHAGTYTVTAPATSGSLALTDAVGTFTTSIAATIAGGEQLVATYTVRVTSDIQQGVDLVNVAAATGVDGAGTPIPSENAALGDTADDDEEDPDPDDTGIAVLETQQPALSVSKIIADILRHGSSIGSIGPVEPGDVVVYQYTIRNVGLGTAYDVDFTDTLPTGLVTEIDAPGHAGTYTVTAPATSGSLALTDAVGTFTTSIAATIAGGEQLVATYTVRVTSDIQQGVDLVNVAAATGVDGAGTPIPSENAALGDTADDDEEDPDPDDTGIAVLETQQPALSVSKIIADILRHGSSIGSIGPVEPGDVVVYQYTIRNVGLGTAYDVDFTDTLPTGLVTEIDAPGHAGTYTVTAPATSGSLALTDAVGTFTTSIAATIAGGEQLVATYTVRVTSDIQQGVDLVNVAAATGVDGAGTPIPSENAALGDTADDDEEDPDPDDTGVSLLATQEPALSVDKRVTGVLRNGNSIGVVTPLLYEDVIEVTVTIRNVGLGIAYAIEFTDTLPAGLETETASPGNPGTYSTTAPATNGSLFIPDGVSSFTTSMNATLNAGETLTATYTVLVTPSAMPSTDLINTVTATGNDGAGTPIPVENAATGDTTDDDAEDPDADDTGIAIVRVGAPALVTRKWVAAIDRLGTAITSTVVEPGDIVTYELGVTNVGTAPARNVNVVDTLPSGFEYAGNATATWPAGNSQTDPSGIPGSILTWTINAELASGDELVLTFDARVTSDIDPRASYTNTMTAVGEDSAGRPIPPDSRDIVAEDDDPDDTSHVTLAAALPALITDKSVLAIVRNGTSIDPDATIQSLDEITYHLQITNVGLGTAYAVNLRDILPTPFAYIPGSTQGSWPQRIGSFNRNPVGAPGPTLLWTPEATLASGETLSLEFDARIEGDVVPAARYANTLQAEGIDGATSPIPPSRAIEIPEDVDPDDQDTAVLIGTAGAPALVTTKRVSSILRSATTVVDTRVEEGDLVTYELTVQNIGSATASNVQITDQLPPGFTYRDNTTTASWPLGDSLDNPISTAGFLQWPLNATLRAGDQLTLRFLSVVNGPIYDGSVYTNRMEANGTGPDGSPIPEDQSQSIPADIDPDDASQATLLGRSGWIEGEGGAVAVPILRKSARIVSEQGCDQWNARVDRLWFQTDIAMYAAAEFEALAELPVCTAQAAESLLPTWIRTLQSETACDAFSNLIQVDALSSVGVPLFTAPLILELAQDLNLTPLGALDARLRAFAVRAGVSLETLPLPQRWIYLEYEGGEPVFETWREEPLGPSGTWSVLDRDLVTSALGMGLLKQSIEAKTLLASSLPSDRFLGWTWGEILSNKILTLDATLMRREAGAIAYLPHASRWDEETNEFVTTDHASLLFDQLSILWGLAQAASFTEDVIPAWPESEASLRFRVREAITRLLHETLVAIETLHQSDEGLWLGRVLPGSPQQSTASTVDLGLLLAALEATQSVVTGEDLLRLERLTHSALDALLSRKGNEGRFSVSASPDPGESSWLLPQLAAIRGILATESILPEALDIALATFEALDHNLWSANIGNGVYASQGSSEWRTYCYTPLEIGLAAGALRELGLRTFESQQNHVLNHLTRFIRSIVNDAALQLSHAIPAGSTLTQDRGVRAITPIEFDEQVVVFAPVLQQRLCLSNEVSETRCSGWEEVDDAPYYRTDISMYAAAILQSQLPSIEDYADANLHAVTFHSGMGIPLAAFASLENALQRHGLETNTVSLTQRLRPVALPFAAGSPQVESETLQWDDRSFDARILASAQGMTLWRESQEVLQGLSEEKQEPHEQLQQRLDVSAILQKLLVLQQLQQNGPRDLVYIPHAFIWQEGARTPWVVIDPSSTTFDALSLLLGLTETYALLSDARIAPLLSAQPFTSIQWESIVVELIDDVLRTLEVAHLDPERGVLVDQSTPSINGWIRKPDLNTTNLGLLATAFDRMLQTFGETSAIGDRTIALLAKEIAFLQQSLLDPRGGYRESQVQDLDASSACVAQTLTGQSGALRALLAAERWLNLPAEVSLNAFRVLDQRFWDASLGMYRSQENLFEWCITPLQLGLVVDVFTRVVNRLPADEQPRLRSRFESHIDRALNGVPLQLSSETGYLESRPVDTSYRYAPVFDERVCYRSAVLAQGTNWAEQGDLVRYTVSVENASDDSFYALDLEDILPEGLLFLNSDPVGDLEDRVIRWTLDELLPSEQHVWRILARIDKDTVLDESLENCATLTYSDSKGEEQTPREACATLKILSPEARADALLDVLHLVYRTDEAMHLASSLHTLADEAFADWPDAALALDLANENLGVLLADSTLGVPLRFAPNLENAEDRASSLRDAFKPFATAASLPADPAVDTRILLPWDSGLPITTDGTGFPVLSDAITPAALGWTAMREVQYIEDYDQLDIALTRYLAHTVRFTLANQLDWIATAAVSSANENAYLPQATRAIWTEDDALSYEVIDARSTVYGQSSLLLGMMNAAKSNTLEMPTRQAAKQLGISALKQLLHHWEPSETAFLSPLKTNEPRLPASWVDHGIAALALAESIGTLDVEAEVETATAILHSLAKRALEEGAKTHPLEETGRLLVLLVATDVLDETSTAAIDGWSLLLGTIFDSVSNRYQFSPRQLRAWGMTPGQLGIVFDVLVRLARLPQEREAALQLASTLIRSHVLEDRVQWIAPTGIWSQHAQFRCSGMAPVFVVRQNMLPPGFEQLP